MISPPFFNTLLFGVSYEKTSNIFMLDPERKCAKSPTNHLYKQSSDHFLQLTGWNL